MQDRPIESAPARALDSLTYPADPRRPPARPCLSIPDKHMNLTALGWKDFFLRSVESSPDADLVPARVFRHDRQSYTVHDGERLRSASLLGKLLYDEHDPASLPTVGDWTLVQPFDDQAIIHDVLPRRTAFYRKEAGARTRRQVLAANIDVVFIVSALDNEFNVRRLERYLVQAAGSGALPVIILNKADLHADATRFRSDVERVAPDVDIVDVSALENTNIESVRRYFEEGITVAFLGSSGVGKSTLVNRLVGEEIQATGTVREDDSRGRHTTTRREMLLVPGGGLVVDTPGLRELQLWADEESLGAVFSDIEQLALTCRFSDCAHDSEPDCAVRVAVDRGKLDVDRLESYNKLKRELAWLDSKQDEVAMLKARRRDKEFGKLMKRINRHNPK
ncbi:MAG: ribosome small subunit-dependent GTPase A, partial [Rhodothermales bacterium]|nr:ribosome small subunit-dependent GTPase A [Rhodothermales bacterium]